MLTMPLQLISAPACTNTPTTSIRPLLAPMCKAVSPYNLYVYNDEMMMAIIIQSYSQYHLLVLYYYYYFLLSYYIFFCIVV